MLFNPTLTAQELVTALVAAPQRLAYLDALAQNLSTSAGELYALWSPELTFTHISPGSGEGFVDTARR